MGSPGETGFAGMTSVDPPSLRGPLAALASWLLAVAYLGGLASFIPFVLVAGGLLLPAAALLADQLRESGLSDETRVCAGGAVAVLLAIPVYYLRRALPLPAALFDAAAVVAISGSSLRTGALRRYVRAALTPTFRAAGWLLAGAVPAVVCLVWLGFEVPRGGGVRYYGLFPIDFANLANFVAMIKASHGLPQFVTAGGGPLHYHWWFFAIAAWLSDFMGMSSRCASALVLSNLLVAVLLAATICAVVADHLRAGRLAALSSLSERARHRLAASSAAVVIIAPFSVYAYQFLVAHAHRSWFTLGVRNNLLLSIVNSMSTFGNNTLALILVLLVGAALAAYREQPSWRLAGLLGLAGFSICGTSVTLALPVILAAAAWILLARLGLGKLWRLLVIAAVIGAVGLPILRFTNILGDSSQHALLSFDRGQFAQNVLLGMAPIWVLAAASLRVRRSLSFWWLLLAACVAVPSSIDIVGQLAVSSTMSMKIASLLAVASGPLVADGLLALMRAGAPAGAATSSAPGPRLWRAIAALALVVGLSNTLVYALQFAAYRLAGGAAGHPEELPGDYFQALSYVRRNTRPDAVVVDPNGDRLPRTISTLLVAERPVWLPTYYTTQLLHADVDNPEIMSRPETWRAWERGGFADEQLAATIAGAADVLVGARHIQSASWEERYAAGDYAVYVSRRRAGR